MFGLSVVYSRLILAAVALGLLLGSYALGRNHERRACKEARQLLQAEAAKETLRLVEKNYSIQVKVTGALANDRTRTQHVLQKVHVLVPSNACDIDGSFRVLHDAAASGQDTPASGRADAAAVAVKDAAATVVENYGACRQDQIRLKALQEWAAEVANKEILCQMSK